MRTVRQLLETKSAEVFSIAPEAPVIDAVRLMAERRIGALLVMEGTRLAGILSERDYARKVVLQGRSSKDTPVRDIMTAQVISVGPQDSADHCMQLVTDSRIRDNRVMVDGARVVLAYRLGSHERMRIKSMRDEMRRALAGLSPMLIKQAENNQRLAHVCGTCRAGEHPAVSVVDADCRAHGLDNLYVADASIFPSSAGTNPALTIAANALRVARGIEAGRR